MLLQHVSVHIKPLSGSHIQCLAKITYLVPMCYRYWYFQCYGGICRHNTDNINNDTHIGTRYVILAKHWMWVPDLILCEPKHVGAAFIILTILII